MFKCGEQRIKRAKQHQHHQNGRGMIAVFLLTAMSFNMSVIMCVFSVPSLLSTNRDSTYRDDDKALDDFNSNGIPKLHKIEKSSSCSSFLFDVLFRGMVQNFKFQIIGLMHEQKTKNQTKPCPRNDRE